MYEQLKSYLDGFLRLSDSAGNEIERNFKVQKFPKGKLIVKAGKIIDQVHFVVKGCFRYYHIKGQKTITYWFEFENFFITSLCSFTTGKPSREYIEALEDSVVLSIANKDLRKLHDHYHEFERLSRLITEDYARRLQNRILGLQIPKATLRYLHLMKTEPQVIKRVPLSYISSYLNISQETLSRIRASIRV